jgi:hypothetical protein
MGTSHPFERFENVRIQLCIHFWKIKSGTQTPAIMGNFEYAHTHTNKHNGELRELSLLLALDDFQQNGKQSRIKRFWGK